MKFTLRFGKHVGRGRLSPEQQGVLDRLERGEIDPEQARKLLGGSVRVFDVSIEAASDESELPPPPEAPAADDAELSEEELARRLVERIAQEVDAEKGG